MPDVNLSQFYIDGAWVAPLGVDSMEVINPATERAIGTLAMGNDADVDAAVTAARAAFPAYSTTAREERLGILQRVLEVYTDRFEQFAEAMSLELGVPIDSARNPQAQSGIDHLAAFIEDLAAFEFEEQLRNGDTMVLEPVGVCGLITPWNWPVNQIALKVAPALATGCTMVLKPAELTPLSAALFADVMHEAGVPAGVFNLVQGAGAVVGAALSRHPEVNMMSFTGSTRAGTSVIKDSADRVTRVTLELGGKSPNLVFADCDLVKAIDEGIDACFINTGQSCDAASRMLVERSVYAAAIELAREKCERVEVDVPEKTGAHLGPLISQTQFDRVQHMIAVGMDEGARLVSGGPGKPEGFETGYYVRPTVFADVTNDMRIAQEEVFGPVLAMIPFDTEAEAVAIANDSPYGLGAYIQTADMERAQRVARALQSGTVNINGAYMSAGSPFGGYKMSGMGREGGAEGLRDFLETKLIAAPGGG
ncbi:MAG: aldehyde dehydrogenase family protein [Pseudomonadota bacterium]